MSKMGLETFLSHRLRDRAAIVRASKTIDAFRRKYGHAEAGFDAVKVIRKLRDAGR